MIIINKLEKVNNSEENGWTRVQSNLEISERSNYLLYVETPRKWSKYLVYERADAFLVGILKYAMLNNHDITCLTPVSKELLYNLQTILIPTLANHDENLYETKITADIISKPLKNAGGVGTGLSMGLDNFNTIKEHLGQNLGITHFLTFNSGVLGGYYQNTGWDFAAQILLDREHELAKEVGVPLIEISDNLSGLYRLRTDKYTSYTVLIKTMSLAKLYGAYLYSSFGMDFNTFSVFNSSDIDSSHYDLLTCYCISTQGSTRYYTEGGEKSRYDKMKNIANFPLAHKYLQSCLTETFNCGMCQKCKRNLLTLDALEKLDDFSQVYDIETYRKNVIDYYTWMCLQIQIGSHTGLYFAKTYPVLKDRNSEMFKTIEENLEYGKLFNRKESLANDSAVLREYAVIFEKLLRRSNYLDTVKVFFERNKYKSVILYGNNMLTQHLFSIKDKIGIKIDYIVENTKASRTVPRLPENTTEYPQTDAIIICNIRKNSNIILKRLQQRTDTPIHDIRDILRPPRGGKGGNV